MQVRNGQLFKQRLWNFDVNKCLFWQLYIRKIISLVKCFIFSFPVTMEMYSILVLEYLSLEKGLEWQFYASFLMSVYISDKE